MKLELVLKANLSEFKNFLSIASHAHGYIDSVYVVIFKSGDQVVAQLVEKNNEKGWLMLQLPFNWEVFQPLVIPLYELKKISKLSRDKNLTLHRTEDGTLIASNKYGSVELLSRDTGIYPPGTFKQVRRDLLLNILRTLQPYASPANVDFYSDAVACISGAWSAIALVNLSIKGVLPADLVRPVIKVLELSKSEFVEFNPGDDIVITGQDVHAVFRLSARLSRITEDGEVTKVLSKFDWKEGSLKDLEINFRLPKFFEDPVMIGRLETEDRVYIAVKKGDFVLTGGKYKNVG